MKVFLCYASEDKTVAEKIQLALLSADCTVFFDEESLPPAGDYYARIRTAIRECDLFVFLITVHSISDGRFTLTELKFVRERWPTPFGKVLAVNIGGVSASAIPNYLTAATMLSIYGNAPSEVRAAVEKLQRQGLQSSDIWTSLIRFLSKHRVSVAFASIGIALAVGFGIYALQVPPSKDISNPYRKSPDARRSGVPTTLHGKPFRNQTQEAQVLLCALGYPIAHPDGLEGPQTASYIKELQGTYNLSLTGSADPQTIALLRLRVEKATDRKYCFEDNLPAGAGSGYVLRHYLTPGQGGIYEVVAKELNVRSTPDGDVIKVLTKGSKVMVVETIDDNWVRIDVP